MSFCFCADQKDVAKNIYEVNRELSGGELSLSACPGVGNRPLRKKKIENPRGCVWGGVAAWLQVKLNHAYVVLRSGSCITKWTLCHKVFRSGILSNFEGI